jgi:PKD repeat protein
MNGSLLKNLTRVATAGALALLVGCSSDSPSAPRQNPPPGGGGGQPSTSWRITLTASPSSIAANSDVPATITVSVRRADNNQPPANGTTILMSTTLGEFGSRGSGVKNGGLELTSGVGAVQLFAGADIGTAVVTAQLESSVAQINVSLQSFAILSVSPATGRPEGGDIVTISGQGIQSPVTVSFGQNGISPPREAPAELISVTSSQIVVKTPAVPDAFLVNQPIDVIVRTKVGTEDEARSVLLGAFTYRSTFFVDRLLPSAGTARGGEVVRILGQGFEQPVRVTFGGSSFGGSVSGGTPAEVLSVTATEIQVRTPEIDLQGASSKVVPVAVTIRLNLAGELTDVLDNGFTLNADPADVFYIASISPNRGTSNGNTSVRITGGGFREPVRVTFGGIAGTVTGVTQTEIAVRTPPFSLGAGEEQAVDVQVTLDPNSTSARSDTLTQAYTYFSDFSNSFFLSGLSPTSGHPNGGETVIITGNGFESPIRVLFGSAAAEVIDHDRTTIRVRTPRVNVPAGSSLPVNVSVTINFNETGSSTDSLSNAYTYTYGSDQPPVVLGVSPATGPNEGGTVVRINGNGFASPVQVFFGQGASASSFLGVEAQVNSVTPTQLVVVTPAATGFGQDNRNQSVDILVRNLDSGLTTIATDAFRYGTNVIITSIGPASGPQTGGTLVTIEGQGFDEPVAVAFEEGSVAVTPAIISVTGTQVVVRTPAIRIENCEDFVGITRLVNIETGLEATGPAFRFEVADLVISGLSPTSGPEAGGNPVTITGAGIFEPVVTFSRDDFEGTGVVTSAASNGSSVTVTAPRFPGSAFLTEACDDNGDGQEGTRRIPTPVDVFVESRFSGCPVDEEPQLLGSYTYLPADTTCVDDNAVQDPPEAAFSFTVVTDTTTVNFTDESTNAPAAWFWDFTNDGTFDSFDQNPTFNFPAFGTYNVRLRAQNAAGFDEVVVAVEVPAPPPPVAGFNFAQISATTASASVQYTDQSTGLITSRAWDFDNNGTTDSTALNPIAAFSTGGTKTSVLRVTGPGGSDTETQFVQVTLVPIANFTFAGQGAGTFTVAFTDTSANAPTQWLWQFGDGATATTQNAIHTYADATQRTVNLTATNSAGSGVTSRQVTPP